MKTRIIITLLSIGFAKAIEEPNSDLCHNDLTPPVICGTNADEFDNLCLAMKEGGFLEDDCTPKDVPNFVKALSPPGLLCAIGSSYKPVVCTATTTTTTTSTTTTTRREIHQNVCAARIIGGFQDTENECTCYEFEDIVYLMSMRFGEDNCQFVTPRPVSESDAQVWYSCNVSGNAESEQSHILGAKLVASGVLGDAPMPLYFNIDLNVENPPSALSMLPSSSSFIFRNDCTDYQRAEMFLRVYN